jgi:hypothetical protein
MDKILKTKSVYLFRNTCHNCYNNIEFPLLGNFGDDYEFILQTIDGKDFCIGTLVNNEAVNFIDNYLQEKGIEGISKSIYTRKILSLIADKLNNKEFARDFPICPICQKLQKSYGDDTRTLITELNYASWNDFEQLDRDKRLKRIKEIIDVN